MVNRLKILVSPRAGVTFHVGRILAPLQVYLVNYRQQRSKKEGKVVRACAGFISTPKGSLDTAGDKEKWMDRWRIMAQRDKNKTIPVTMTVIVTITEWNTENHRHHSTISQHRQNINTVQITKYQTPTPSPG